MAEIRGSAHTQIRDHPLHYATMYVCAYVQYIRVNNGCLRTPLRAATAADPTGVRLSSYAFFAGGPVSTCTRVRLASLLGIAASAGSAGTVSELRRQAIKPPAISQASFVKVQRCALEAAACWTPSARAGTWYVVTRR
jgi:hypothetical protein